MNINYDKLNKKTWFEDIHGNPCEKDDPDVMYYRHVFPMEYNEHMDYYEYRPKTLIQRLLCKTKKGYNYLLKKHGRSFYRGLTSTTSFGGEWSQRCIVAMVNSGEFTLEQAIFVYANSCERCMNALLYKYLDGEEGYPEFSDEWKNCNTECEWCKGYNNETI